MTLKNEPVPPADNSPKKVSIQNLNFENVKGPRRFFNDSFTSLDQKIQESTQQTASISSLQDVECVQEGQASSRKFLNDSMNLEVDSSNVASSQVQCKYFASSPPPGLSKIQYPVRTIDHETFAITPPIAFIQSTSEKAEGIYTEGYFTPKMNYIQRNARYQ